MIQTVINGAEWTAVRERKENAENQGRRERFAGGAASCRPSRSSTSSIVCASGSASGGARARSSLLVLSVCSESVPSALLCAQSLSGGVAVRVPSAPSGCCRCRGRSGEVGRCGSGMTKMDSVGEMSRKLTFSGVLKMNCRPIRREAAPFRSSTAFRRFTTS